MRILGVVHRHIAEAIGLGALLGAIGAAAVLAGPAAAAEDPPLRVGSLNYFSGEVSFAVRSERGDPGAGDALDWNEASFNQPVCQDMSLKTGSRARALIRIGPNAIQLAGDTELDMLNLSDTLIEASIRQGRVHLQLGRLDPGETVELETSRGSLWLLEPGAYDIETGTADQPTRITVFEGKARFIGGQADHPIGAGEAAEVTGAYPAVVTAQRLAADPSPTPAAAAPPASNPAPAAAASAAAPASSAAGDPQTAAAAAAARSASSDDFLFWVNESEAAPRPEQATRHVPRQMTGYEELDSYGSWQSLDDYGAVWFPTSVPADWAPYRFGHWTTIPPWGWTWIDDQPWGFAPFHFGRWVNVDNRWGWAPGALAPHPVYAPALVAFVDAPGPSAADQGPDPPVGWVPLAPGEPYSPWYGASPAYVQAVDVVYPARFHDHGWRGGREGFREGRREAFGNRRFATFAHRDAFVGGHSIGRDAMRMPAARLEHVTAMTVAPRAPAALMRRPPGEMRGEPNGAAAIMRGSPGAMRGAAPTGTLPGGMRGRPSAAAAPAVNQPGPRGGIPGAAPTGRPGAAPVAAAARGGPHGAAVAPAVNQAGPHQVGLSRPPGSFGAGPGAPAFGAPMARGGPQPTPQYGRPDIFHTPAPASRVGAPPFGQAQAARTPQMMGRPGVAAPMARGAPQATARPAAAPVRSGGGAAAAHKK